MIVEDSRLVGIGILSAACLGSPSVLLIVGFLVKCRELVALWFFGR